MLFDVIDGNGGQAGRTGEAIRVIDEAQLLVLAMVEVDVQKALAIAANVDQAQRTGEQQIEPLGRPIAVNAARTALPVCGYGHCYQSSPDPPISGGCLLLYCDSRAEYLSFACAVVMRRLQ